MSKLLLVIDDDPVERTILERVLVGAGYRVMTAADGQEGLAALPPLPSSVPDLHAVARDPVGAPGGVSPVAVVRSRIAEEFVGRSVGMAPEGVAPAHG